MKRWSIILITLLITVLTVNSAWSQDRGRNFYKQSYVTRNSGSFSADHSILSVGIGLVNHNGISGKPPFGPLYLQYEHGIIDEIGIGGFTGLSLTSKSHKHYTHHRNTWAIGAIGYYHFNKLIPVNQLDVYAGLGVGMKVKTDSYTNNYKSTQTNSSAIYVFRAGARWYFTPKFAVYGETGSDDLSALTIGMTFKL